MKVKLEYTLPSEEIGFIEDKRSFVVQGIIKADHSLSDDAKMIINLLDEDNNLIRHIHADKKDGDLFLYHPDLVTYSEKEDPKRLKLKEYGFPELSVLDKNKPYDSLYNATIKLWFNDHEFKGIITNASSIKQGSIFEDGFNFIDENNNPYNLLPKGQYTLQTILKENGQTYQSFKKIIISKRKNQIICRFNPLNHKNRMIQWANKNHYSIINDLLPGYLDSYLGNWDYHKGLLKMYRANDICLFENVDVRMFVYLIDEESTSYKTELGYLEKNNLVNSKRFHAYYYDIGEAIIGENKPYYKIGKIVEFNKNETIKILRVDEVNKQAKENVFYLNEKAIINSQYELNNLSIKSNSDIQIMGILKPIQFNPNDYILLDDNTYMINNYPERIIYSFNNHKYKRKIKMIRIDNDKNIGNSVFEFYNLIHIDNKYKNQNLTINIQVLDHHKNIIANTVLNLRVI